MKNEKVKIKREKIRRSPSLYFLIFLFSFFFFLLAGCRFHTPVIHSIRPQIGTMGEPVTITGAFFGKERNESYVTIAGVQPTTRSYLNWSDNEITLRIPELGEAGLIYVYVKGRKSNGALFANQATVPVQVQGGETGAGPRVISVTPNAGAIGALVSINGTGFGSSRGNGGVFFAWNAQAPASAPAEARLPEFAEVSETDFGYELWTDRLRRAFRNLPRFLKPTLATSCGPTGKYGSASPTAPPAETWKCEPRGASPLPWFLTLPAGREPKRWATSAAIPSAIR